jgi:hypothetical protein
MAILIFIKIYNSFLANLTVSKPQIIWHQKSMFQGGFNIDLNILLLLSVESTCKGEQ